MHSTKEHGPKAGCNWRTCGVTFAGEDCPFVKDITDHITDLVEDLHAPHACEYRQYWTSTPTVRPEGFYCIYDPEHRKYGGGGGDA